MTPLRQPPQPKMRRRPAGTVAVRAIRKYQKNVYLLVPKTSFQRLAKEIATDYQARLYACNTATDLTKQQVVQYLVSMFQDAMRVAQHAHRETIQPRDIALVLRVCGDSI
ncbi:histone-fold-containing protein [Mycena albidolilacea]|uniref:Histone-fold-containing protein n=1 Tax=Mycena albidolilacea TaxID=1033008 RepID=A0AAD6Z2B5_9AGAR|nr:histone-fold-containing protein [Mycena albidolilacea]